MTEKEAYIAFNLLQNIGSAGVERLIAKHGGIVQAWENVENKTGRDGKVVNLEEELEKAAKYRVSILTPVDKEYPKRLLDTRGHPLCLYLKGSVEALQVASVAMVGTRRQLQEQILHTEIFPHICGTCSWYSICSRKEAAAISQAFLQK